MTDQSLAQRRPAPSGLRPFDSLPPTTSGMDIERALELAGVDAMEFALLASTTFKEASTLEELVTHIAEMRRRKLDGSQVFYVRFGGKDADPSMHVAISGLRAIAAGTGSYGGGTEPRFSGAWEMPLDERDSKKTKSVPEKCVITIYRIVQGRSCAFDGTAWMEESYPGVGGRGRTWRERPRHMLAIAAERVALRRAFPSETSGINDVDEGEVSESEPAPVRTLAESAALHDRIYAQEDEPPPPAPKRQRPLGELIERYQARLDEACAARLLDSPTDPDWVLPKNPTRQQVVDYGTRLAALFVGRPRREDPADEVPVQGHQQAGEELEPGTPPSPAPADPWMENRRLYFDAVNAGLRPRTLRNDTPLEEIAAYNRQLEEQIAARETAESIT
jgi:hypothetical protein